ncbi:MAG: BamA/TamA family outer membrane protein [Planctomycetota bacterium]|nr:BamA/TamA family outer membrane protein [Planctomycetota bacterium]
MLARLIVAAGLSVALAAQEVSQPPQGPGVRVDRPLPTISGEVYLEGAVRAMKGKPVRSIEVTKVDREAARVAPVGREEAAGIIRGLEARVGQPFEPRKVSADCATLWSERRLVVRAYAEAVDGEVSLTYQIDLQVARYEEVEFVGNEELDLDEIYALVGFYAGRRTTRTEAEAMRKLLLARYRRDGFAFSEVLLEDLPALDLDDAGGDLAQPKQRLRVVIEEGPKVTVGEVDFVGNRSFAADPILGLFGTDGYLVRDAKIESEPAQGFLRGGAFSREVLSEDLDRLRLFYRSRGFLEATVDLADVRFSEDRESVDLSFVIVEGPRYRIRSVKVVHVSPDQTPLAVDPLYPPEEVAAELSVGAGDYYDHEQLQRDQQAIEEFYGRRGHPSVNFPGMRQALREGCRVFTPLEVYGEGPEVDIIYQVSEGAPKSLRDIVIRGNARTRDAVIRRRFRVLPGERIDMQEVRRALRRIEGTRFFQDPATMQGPRLQIEPVAGDPDRVDLGLDLQDGPTGELRWGVGVSTGIGAQAQVTFNKRNFDLWSPPSSSNPITAVREIIDAKAFHGGGQNLSVLLAPGSRQSQFAVTYVEPDIFEDHLDTYSLRVTGQRRIRRLPDGYTSDVLGTDLGLSRNFTEFLNAGVSLRQETVEIDNLAQDATILAFDAEGRTELRGPRLSLRYRDYDDPLRPNDGVDFRLSFEAIGGLFGGEENLTKWEHQADVYYPISENEMGHRTVFHWRQFFGFAQAYGSSDDVFLTERFYMGGANLRGFDFRRAGPTQFQRPIGGEVIYTSTYEVFFPLIATRFPGEVRDRELLRWVLFTDIGLLGLGPSDPTFGQLRASTGVGLRVEIPFLQLPIALDLGWPWYYEETDARRQLYFSISR